jgi:hypothetical protein
VNYIEKYSFSNPKFAIVDSIIEAMSEPTTAGSNLNYKFRELYEILSKGDLVNSIAHLDIGLETYQEDWRLYYLKASIIYKLQSQAQPALQILDDGRLLISRNRNNPFLLHLSAEILLQENGDLNLASNFIDLAEVGIRNNYDQWREEYTSMGLDDSPLDLSLLNTLNELAKNRSECRLRILATAVDKELEDQKKLIKDSFEKIEQDKLNTINFIALFSAVVALMILTGQFALNMKVKDGLYLIMGLCLILIIFISITSYVFDTKKKGIIEHVFDSRIYLSILAGFLLAILLRYIP